MAWPRPRHPLISALVCGFFPMGLFMLGAGWTFIPGGLAVWVITTAFALLQLRRWPGKRIDRFDQGAERDPNSNVRPIE